MPATLTASGKRVHFIGIGGIGMSGIARLYLSLGYDVQGSDVKKSEALAALEKMGARVLIGHDPAHVDGASLVVYSSSIKESHPERIAAAERGLKIIHRADALADLCRGKYTIAVTGTHGKTTTTALIGSILREDCRDPSIVVGGMVRSFGGNACHGFGREMVIEADESDSSFLKFSPDLEVITNIEEEHMDHYQNVAAVRKAYWNFLGRLSAGGEWFGCGEDARVRALARRSRRPVTLYGFEARRAADYAATDIVECPGGKRGIAFTVCRADRQIGRIQLRIPGRHNALNALAATAVGMKLGIDFQVIARALAAYEGAGRRFDVKYEDKRYLVVDDYAHHPTEIQKTLEAARTLKRKRLVAFFQPHRYSRTESLMKDFAKSFRDADELVVTDVYAASEAPRAGVNGEILCEAIRAAGHRRAAYVERARLSDAAASMVRPGDLFIAMGAGDIGQVAADLAEDLRRRSDLPEEFRALRGRVAASEPLSRHTTLRIGGPAEFWVEPLDTADLRRTLKLCAAKGWTWRIFGAGSNILAPDDGLRGVTLQLGSAYFRQMRVEKGKIVARGGVPNSLFIQFALDHGFGGCEFLAGIPGQIGGSVAMNAGSHGQSVESCLESARVMDPEGRVTTWKPARFEFGYRSSSLKNAIILEAVFGLPRVPKADVLKKLAEYRDHRAKTQDLQHPSAGCLFKNPLVAGCSSGRLIDEAGLKGFRAGNAQVSERHANFMINLGGATAADAKQLIEEVRSRVREASGITLETEVKIL